MCGIAGLLNLRGDAIDGALLRRMTLALSHRGPESTAFWVRGAGQEDRNGRGVEMPPCAGLGHTRLRIIDVEGGDQPIWNEDRSCLIVFNGEIYNFRELRAELQARGHSFATVSDTEAILHAYEQWGEACTERLRGMFAFAIWNEHRQELFLARDRMGIKPLYLAWRGQTLAFASEIKALLQDPMLDRDIDPAALDAYLSLGYVPGPGTILRTVTSLPAAHSLTLRVGGRLPPPRRYWQVPLGKARHRSETECLEELDLLLRDVVARHLISDVPLGVFLSGGADSSTLVAIAAALSSSPLRTFSIGFPGSEGYDETPYAREVARRFGTEHHACALEPNALEVLPELVHHLDQPLADPSAIPLYSLCRMTREHVTVALAGDGGDELFGGYERYYWDRVAARYSRLPRPIRAGLVEPFLSRLPRLPLDVRRDPFRRARKFVRHASGPPALRYFHWFELMTPEFKQELYGDRLWMGEGPGADSEDRLAAGGPSFLLVPPAAQAFEQVFAEAAVQGASALDTMQYCDTQTMLRDDLLHKCDRVSMAVALEARVPFLDHGLVEWAFTLPAEMRVRGRTLKYLLKRWLSRHLPPELVYRRKQGFEVPLYGWLTGPTRPGQAGGRDWLRELLLAPDSLADGLFRREGVRRLVERLVEGERVLALPVYSLAAWELWRRQLAAAPLVRSGS
jgi:asparagine synthase (glutamine-hydrolysing)